MYKLKEKLIDFSIHSRRIVVIATVLFTLITGAFLPLVVIDTDPENMLEIDEPVRVFHNESKKTFDLSDTIVLGIINENNPDGVFNTQTLSNIYTLTQYAKTLRWEKDGTYSGVIEVDMLAPSLVDHMAQAGPGQISFEWLMSAPPKTRKEALAIRDKSLSNPMLKGHMVSEDGKSLTIYLPLTDKLLSYKVYKKLSDKIKTLRGEEEFHIAGLPVAESAIGVEMFNQMTIAAPLTMVVILGLLFLFFKKWELVILPMIVATVSVVSSLGLMTALGFPVHILSSMLPTFLMPIAICDTVHVLSDFFETYTKEKGRKQSIKEVMHKLFMPILYTSLTTSAGFLSFMSTSIPPARIFGVFVAVGVMVAWLASILLVPAYIMMLPEKTLENFGHTTAENKKNLRIAGFVQSIGKFSFKHTKFVLGIMALLVVTAIWGISQININDNYAKRFVTGHPIREADTALNKHFGGTYTAYLVLEGEKNEKQMALIDEQMRLIDQKSETANDIEYDLLQEQREALGVEKEKLKVFKRPDVLEYMVGLQAYLERTELAGKTTSVADVVRKVNQELIDGHQKNYRIPEKLQGVSECYMQFQQSHRPNDLWHMVTPDFNSANIMVQFTRGDSTLTGKAEKAVEKYMKTHKPPVALSVKWAGLHYVNYIFQEKMFWEMLTSLCGSFVIVLIMSVILFRSVPWGIACMVPLTFTITSIYGVTGIIGKDYDMPIAVIGAISLGIGIDFAVHFLERSRQMYKETGSLEKAIPLMFGEPALAITRNVLIVALGFLPLMVAHLVPYKTTAIMLFGILSFSGFMTLFCFPAILKIGEKIFFKNMQTQEKKRKMTKKSKLAASILLLLAFAPGIACAQDLSVDEIVKKANHMALYQGADAKGKISMLITDKQGRQREREFNMLRLDEDEKDLNQKYFVFFNKPADVRKMVFMVHKNSDVSKDDDRWLYMPSLDLVKRIAAGDKRTSFVGSDFLYEDISGRSVLEDNHLFIEKKDGQYVIKNIPKQPELVEFAYYKTYIDTESFMPLKMEFFKEPARLYRVIENVEIQNIKAKENGKDTSYPTVTKSIATNLETGSKTEITFHGVNYNKGIGKEIFSERYLRNPPREARR